MGAVAVPPTVTSSPSAVAPPPSHQGRTIAAAVLGVLTVVFLSVAIIGVWARATIVDRDNFTEMVSEALEEPEVQAGLAAYITTQVFAAVDVDSVVSELLPDQLDRLAPTVVAGAQTAVQNVVERALANDEVQELVTGAVGRAHDAAMRLLQGDGLGDGITVDDGEVTLDLLPLVARGLEGLQSLGLFDDVTIPTLSSSEGPEEERSQLSAAIGRALPEDFGQLVVYRSDSLADAQESVQQAQRMAALAKRALWLLVALALVLLVATLVVAPRRWRAVVLLGVGTAATMVLLRVVARQVVDEAPDLAARPGGKAAIRAVLGAASSGLLRIAGILLLVALVAAVIGIARRGWPRADLVLLGAVAIGTAVVVVAGVSAVSLLLGLAVGIAVPFVVRLLFQPPQQPGLAAG